ncbi:MAG TPA: hypothetical protein VKL99_17570 [Candidatus Angelobacter sp.]|nr:hypothetical protein [Candidatus Angelobacter sp.]
MTDAPSGPLAERLRRLTMELRSLELELRSGQAPDKLQLQEFRNVLDNARLTAWTVSELLNARERDQDLEKVLSFVVAERLRRSTQLLKELGADIEREGLTWQTHGIQSLFEALKLVQIHLMKLIEEHRGRFEKVKEAGR